MINNSQIESNTVVGMLLLASKAIIQLIQQQHKSQFTGFIKLVINYKLHSKEINWSE